MRKKYKNELFQTIKDLGYIPDDFSLLEDNDYTLSLKYKDTPFYFTINNSSESYDDFEHNFIMYAPDFPESDIFPEKNFEDFASVLSSFKYWTEKHLKEYEMDEFEPDLWSEYKSGKNSLNFNEIDFSDKTKFSTIEQKQILMSINELKLLINKNFKTTGEEQKLVDERLDYLIESSKKLNKFDWKSLVLSSIIGIATTLTLDAEKGKLLFELFRQVFSSVKNIGQ